MAESSQWKESLSLEETNKIRISLGLKPIADPAASSAGEAKLEGDALAEDNYRKRREAEQKEKDAADLKSRIDKARNQKERMRKLVGRTLGEADEDDAARSKVKKEEGAAEDDDTKAWVKKQKKRAKELAAKRAREQEEADRLAEEEERERANKYGEEDLAGLKVAHDADAFDEGEDVVLTLKDSRVLDDEDDELHNVNMTENAKTKHALELKKKGRQAGQYTGLDDDEFDGVPGSSRGVLNKYDEDFDAIKVDGFQLGAAARGKGKGRAMEEGGLDEGGPREKVKLSMDYTKSFTSDHLQEGEAGFRKLKKKKKRAGRITTLVDEEEVPNGTAMDVDGAPAAPKRIERASLDETNLIDDDDLQASLARQRREAAKQKIKELKARSAAASRPANGTNSATDVVKKEEDDDDAMTSLSRPATAAQEEDDEGDVLVLDDTSEFVRNISLAATAAAERAEKEAQRASVAVKRADEGMVSVAPQIKAEEVDEPLTELGEAHRGGWAPARADGEEDEQMYDPDAPPMLGRAVSEVSEAPAEDAKPEIKAEDDDALVTTGGEQLVSRGLASTLSLLRHQGLVKPRTPEEIQREKEFKEREAWLAAQRRRDMERERERLESRRMGDKKDQQQREYDNRMRDQRDAQATLEAYSNYKPAWKQLNYDFHGHGSGAKKKEKRLAKIENERKQAAMAAGDTPLSTAAAFAARAEKTGSATMILGVGNNNAAPVQEETLGGISKIEKNLKGKGKPIVAPPPSTRNNRNATPGDSQTVINDIPMRPLPLSGETSGTPEPGLAPRKAGFAPVRSFSPAVRGEVSGTASAEGTLGPSGGSKLSIAVKRKATAEGEGSPASKRRS
ncbi:u4 tri-SnRNP-associated protein 1 [Rhodotorula toruloides]|uniref:U4 tri-SnRNP-associated protein 1 n=1 Tax=Rhodotorula toruloides TaxID=5286 RepID=A0A511KAI8_RHOTO|nr:u4 tri-SnRNP-associated protein 1 [Rhodotorula toruloides]